MKKQLLLTTALVVTLATPVMAEEQQGWFDTMKQSVTSWFQDDTSTETNTDVEAYLDEVTIAVPPMTGEEAAAIQPAAGDYIDDTAEESETPATNVAPGSSSYGNDESSFNTEFTSDQGSVAAFEDNTMNADDLADIMPAAGDAEEITDESVIVADDTSLEATVEANADTAVDTPTIEKTTAEAEAVAEEIATETKEIAIEAQETAQDMATDTMDAIENTAPAAGTSTQIKANTQTEAETTNQ